MLAMVENIQSGMRACLSEFFTIVITIPAPKNWFVPKDEI